MKISKENKYLLIGTVVFLILLWWTRFQTFQAGTVSYRIDRLSGEVEAYWLYKDLAPVYFKPRPFEKVVNFQAGK